MLLAISANVRVCTSKCSESQTCGWLSTGVTESETCITCPVSHCVTNRNPSAASRIRCFSSWSVKNEGLYAPSDPVFPVPTFKQEESMRIYLLKGTLIFRKESLHH